jgi:hypothetical protein
MVLANGDSPIRSITLVKKGMKTQLHQWFLIENAETVQAQ